MRSPHPFSVLVVDDDRDTVESTVAVLALHGFRAAGAVGGCDAVEAAADGPDVALIDLAMPGEDGFEVARRLLALPSAPVLVAVTGVTTDAGRERARAAGFQHYLLKPVPPDELVAFLRQCQQTAARCEQPAAAV